MSVAAKKSQSGLPSKPDQASTLDLAGLGDLAALLDIPPSVAGMPTEYDMDTIHEDPENSRTADNPGFSEESIAELAESIKRKNGVKSPISLRRHPNILGHFIINHGHRRFRAARVAGLKKIRAFEDPDFDDFDQLVENIQREDLTAREIADRIGRKLAQGMTQADIARELGKSKGWISQHVALLNLPDPVAEAVASGQVNDVTLANELASAHRKNAEAVEEILRRSSRPTRADVKAIRHAEQETAAAEKSSEPTTAAAEPMPLQRPANVEGAFAEMRERREWESAELPVIRQKGEAALCRLLPVAQRDTGQSGVIARFLLNLYNGNRFPFDNTDLRRLDTVLLEDCLAVLRMDSRPLQEVHMYFEGGSKIWEQLAKVWRVRDFHGEASWRTPPTRV